MKEIRYYLRIKEMDGSWTDWREVTEERYNRAYANNSWDTDFMIRERTVKETDG